MMLTDDIAALIGFPCEAVLYGVNCVLFIIASTTLLWRQRGTQLNIPMLIANTALFTCCTLHFSLEFNHYYNTLRTTGVANFGNETKTTFASDVVITLTDFIGDLILIYRCWNLWARNFYIVILPLLTAMSGFISIAVGLHIILDIAPNAPSTPSILVPLGTAGFTLPLCTNVIVTALIVGRIWYFTRSPVSGVEPPVRKDGTAWRAMAIVIESGVLYLTAQLIFLVLFIIEHPAQQIMAPITLQIYGIAPTLIIIRVGLGISSDVKSNATSTHLSWAIFSKHQPSSLGTSTSGFTDGSDTTRAVPDKATRRFVLGI